MGEGDDAEDAHIPEIPRENGLLEGRGFHLNV